jgi:hypothetical protein
MSTITIPAIGDSFAYEVIVSHASLPQDHSWPGNHGVVGEHKRGWFKDANGKSYVAHGCDLDRKRACAECFDQWQTRTSTVVSVQHYMDNSIEVVLADGTRRTVVAPNGDACF